MDGEAGWWTTSGNIGLPPLARAMGVGRQQQVAILCPVQRYEAIDTQGINSGGYSNDNMASDFSTPQTHAINDGSSVIINSVIDGVL